MRINLIPLVAILLVYTYSSAQDLSAFMDDLAEEETVEFTEKTFRTPRVINMHSVENPYPGELIFNIGHRFGRIDNGIYDLFGLDNATMRLGFDMGITPWLSTGIGRSSFQKSYDAFVKGQVIRQNNQRIPLTIALYLAASQNTIKNVYPDAKDNFSDRLSMVSSIIISRKFSERLSLQANPVFLRANYLPESLGSTDDLALGLASRVMITHTLHVNLEYIAKLIDNQVNNQDVLSIGVDIETGGHVFQLFLSNTFGISDKAYLINTMEGWGDGAVFFGFNITRVFYLY